ncbi:MAG: protein kinase [Vicinamibacterales bacterium]
MSLSPGLRIGPYEIGVPLGAGGMGEVYRATDTHLKRAVAIKVLPASVAGDADRLARFQREAEVLAALNHPNIAHIHGLEKNSGVTALVMELVEGEDLSLLISRGPIVLAEALSIAKQIADALEAAHEQGIVHRDLKPANVKIRPDGVVKVLDFGLAKALAPAMPSSADAMNSPTLTTPAMTQMGMILGTASYMAPEQARGKVVDRRADIWAFGAVLFEMLTGQRAFPGEDVTDTIVSVVSKEPDWRALPPVPANLRRLLARCLKKDPKARLRDVGEARVQLEELIAAGPDEPSAPTAVLQAAPAPRTARSRALMWAWAATTVALAVAVLTLWAPWRVSGSADSAPTFTPLSFEQGGQTPAVWSPDGKAVAFGARQKPTDPNQIHVRYVDSAVATQITQLTSGALPIAWTRSGRIVFSTAAAPAGLWSVSPVGGEPEPLQAIDRPSSASIAPDGNSVAWLHLGDDGVHNIWTSSPIGSAPKPYEPSPFAVRRFVNSPSLRFSPDGRQILFFRGSTNGEEAWLLPYPQNAATPPRRIFQDLPMSSGTPTFSWMPDSRRVVVSTSEGWAPEQLYMADTVSGAFSLFSRGTTDQGSPSVSPDGKRLAFVEAPVDYDVVSVDVATAAVTPVIATQRSEQMPAWGPGDSGLVYVTDRNGPPQIWLRKPGQPDRPIVTERDFPSDTTRGFMAPTLSPDGTRVIYTRLEKTGPTRLWMSAVAGGAPVRLLKGPAAGDEYGGGWSPDGRWFVFWSSQEGTTSLMRVKTGGESDPEVLRPAVDRTGSNIVPAWSPTGEWILYFDQGMKLISPDGKTIRDLPSIGVSPYGFSRDGHTLYGVRRVTATRTIELFSVRVSGGAERVIGLLAPEHFPAARLGPAQRMTPTPDGRSLTFSIGRRTSNLWLMDGLDAVRIK